MTLHRSASVTGKRAPYSEAAMNQSLKEICDLLGPLRAYGRALNRQGREGAAEERARHKVRDQRRPRCRYAAYPWPHRPSGGLCRYPELPTER
jgi:hypothetical protein